MHLQSGLMERFYLEDLETMDLLDGVMNTKSRRENIERKFSQLKNVVSTCNDEINTKALNEQILKFQDSPHKDLLH